MRIAIVAYYFKPDQAIGAVRPENWANWLAEAHTVTVVTRECITPGEPPLELATLPYRILRPVSWGTRLLDRVNRWRHTRRIARAANAPTKTHIQTTPASGIFTYRMPCAHDIWFLAAYRGLRQVRPELIIATHSPYIDILAALMYKLLHPKTRLWVDFRDPWTDNSRAVGITLIREFERWLETIAINKAAVLSTVSHGLAEQFSAKHPAVQPQVILNCPIASDTPQPAVTPAENSALRLVYTGTLAPGWRDPVPLFRLLGQLKTQNGFNHKNVEFLVASPNPAGLVESAQAAGIAENVHYLGKLDRPGAIALQRSADVLVLLESDDPNEKGVLTGKVFEYLLTDKPILLIGPGPDSELYQLLDRNQRLLTLDNLARWLKGEWEPAPQTPIDYRVVSRAQLESTINALQ